jgi:hypothetical protein
MSWKLHPSDLILNGIFLSNGTQNGQGVIEHLPGTNTSPRIFGFFSRSMLTAKQSSYPSHSAEHNPASDC